MATAVVRRQLRWALPTSSVLAMTAGGSSSHALCARYQQTRFCISLLLVTFLQHEQRSPLKGRFTISEHFLKRKGRWGSRIAVVAAAIALMLGLTAQQALAVTFTEVGDAPSLPPGQTPTGFGALTAISGSVGGTDEEDLYRICVTGGGFSATTTGSALGDPQLFLFDDDGTGVARGKVANDDNGTGLQSTLPTAPASLDNGGTLSYPPGVYYLGISSFDHDPRDSGGNLIFPSFPFQGVYGPNPGA